MLNIEELQTTRSDYIKNIAELHRKAFPTFFLTQMGKGFLYELYRGYMEDINSGIIVAKDDNHLIGFIAYSKDYSNFFKGLIRKRLINFTLYSLVALLRKPIIIRRLLRAFKKSEDVIKEELYVELASICVDPNAQCLGVGSKLIDYLKDNVDFQKYAYINLETDSNGNDSVNRFYIKNGFKLEKQFITAEGRKMNEYRYAPERCE